MKRIMLVALILAGVAGCSPRTAKPGNWQPVRSETISHQFMYAGFASETEGMVLGQTGSGHTGRIYTTTDAGASWNEGQNTSRFLYGLDIVDANVAWVCGDASFVRKSVDGGKTWQAVGNFGSTEPNQCRFLSFLDAQTGWAATPTELGQTTDGGQIWTDISLPTGGQTIAALDLRTPAEGAVLDSSGRLFMTHDDGKSWSELKLDFTGGAMLGKMPSPSVAMRLIDEARIMIALYRNPSGSGFTIWSAYTEDGGKSWQMAQVPAGDGLLNLYLSRDGRILTTSNTGLLAVATFRYQQP
ncbi:MAG TPA: YCF48-related protein [Anaerolineales bacterium]|nr:YCF48-related protein [Anaerolineales bacterium]